MPAISYIPTPKSEYLDLPNVNICLFIEPANLEAAQAAMKELRGGDTKAILAAALAVATRYSRGYRIEYADEPEEMEAAPVVIAPSVIPFGRSPFSSWRA